MRRVVVVGGGIAGLCAATFAARAGARVVLFERMSETGGRGRSRDERGFTFNMGPHALYLRGPAIDALRELDIEPPGNSPPTNGGLAYLAGRLHALPGGTVSLLTTGLLGLSEKLELAALLTRMSRLAEQGRSDLPIGELLEREVRSKGVRDLLHALVRLTSYSNMPGVLSSDSALAQVMLGLGPGVRYLDGGWQTMVDALEAKAVEAGVTIRRGVKVERVSHDGVVRGLGLAGGELVAADAAVLALGPGEASELVDDGAHPFFARALAQAIPVRAACLDLGLTRLPNPKRNFAIGIDRALYFSVHSAAAKLAPEGAASVAVVRYLAADERPDREELEADFDGLLDAIQPGWRQQVVTRKLMREQVVTHDVPQAARGGLTGRTGGQVTGIGNLWLAGDWVGHEGMLVDASFASGRAAARGAAGAAGIRVAA